MGSYRLLLAFAVAVSHSNVYVFGYNQGVVAVVSFFLMSGLLMTALVRNCYLDSASVGRFYLDRIGRLYPQFALYLVVAALVAAACSRPLPAAPAYVAANVLMVPLGFFMYAGIGDQMLLPATWSLGLESMFYLTVPWLLIYRTRRTCFLLSLAVFATAFFGLLDPDVWGYRLLPGTLFVFLLGSYMADEKPPAALLVATWVACAAMLAAVALLNLQRHNLYEVLGGVVLGLPAVWLLRAVPRSGWDELLGNVSYGVFLAHWPIKMAANAMGFTLDSWPQLAGWLLASSLAGWLSYHMVERPVIRWRRGLRSPVASAKSGNTPESKQSMAS